MSLLLFPIRCPACHRKILDLSGDSGWQVCPSCLAVLKVRAGGAEVISPGIRMPPIGLLTCVGVLSGVACGALIVGPIGMLVGGLAGLLLGLCIER